LKRLRRDKQRSCSTNQEAYGFISKEPHVHASLASTC